MSVASVLVRFSVVKLVWLSNTIITSIFKAEVNIASLNRIANEGSDCPLVYCTTRVVADGVTLPSLTNTNVTAE